MNFQEATEKVKDLKNKPSNEELLQLYSLYKQATNGDCDTDRPSFWNYVAAAKWDAWDALCGTTKSDAEQRYVSLVEKLINRTLHCERHLNS
jgi:diazepam-binding inhibitor (GABA receptor modulating acyl-CoA-binding protein)